MASESESMLRGIQINGDAAIRSRTTDLHAYLNPRTRQPVPRRIVYLLLAIIFLFIVVIGSIRTKVVHVKLPQLDDSEWVQSLQGWFTGKEDKDSRKAVVLASYKDQDVRWLRWLDSNLTSGWEIYRYVNDAPPADYHANYLTVQNPEGREALAYMTYIIDYYHNLPEYVVFIHGDKRAWHQPERIFDRLSALNLSAVDDEGYISLQCQGGGCDANSMFYFDGTHPDDHRRGTMIKDFWDDMMVPRNYGQLPPRIGRQCCAQFAVPKQAILQHNLTFWKDMREPFLEGPDHERPSWRGPLMDGHKIGLFYEMIWHIIFGKEAVNCLSYEHCEKVHFQDLIHCDRRITGWDDQEGWRDIQCTNDLRKTSQAD